MKKMTLHMPGIQGGRGGASTHKKTEIDHEVLMECPQGGEIQYFYGALGTLQLIKKALSTWKAFRSIFDQDHKSGQLCLSAHIPDWRRVLIKGKGFCQVFSLGKVAF